MANIGVILESFHMKQKLAHSFLSALMQIKYQLYFVTTTFKSCENITWTDFFVVEDRNQFLSGNYGNSKCFFSYFYS